MADIEIYFGDNLQVLPKLPADSFSLIYIDPPFNTGKMQSRTQISTVRDDSGDRVGFKGKRYRTVKIGTKGYLDVFDDYMAFLEPRLKEAYRLLCNNGSLFFHIDYREAHYCKLLLDHIFGRDSFINEIVWAYDYGARSKKRWSAKHDVIFWYAKNANDYIFNFDEMDRIPYMAPGLVGREKAERGKTPTDVWWHTIVSPNGKEKTGYPTQKPRGIIDRIVRVHTRPGDLICDFFAGSGTLGESAAAFGRKCVLVDENDEAMRVIERRFGGMDVQWHGWVPDSTKAKTTRGVARTKTLDKEVRSLESISKSLEDEYKHDGDEKHWDGSPFAWIKARPSGQAGAIGKKLVAGWLKSHDFNALRSPDSDADRLVEGRRIAIKTSTLWEKGVYRFQQIRDQNYEFVLCLGLSPFTAHCWVIPKDDIFRLWKKGSKISGQHRGVSGSDTAWIPVSVDPIPDWLSPFGGSLTEGLAVLSKYTNFTPN